MAKQKNQIVVTTWMERFSQALTLLCCGRVPPIELCVKWVDLIEDNKETLQDWVHGHGPVGLPWTQSIAIIDAAELLADSPEEGCGHFDKHGNAHGY